MLLMVRYVDEEYGIVEDYCLDYLIATGRIAEFARSDGWVTVGRDPVREKECNYEGPERRRHRGILQGVWGKNRS